MKATQKPFFAYSFFTYQGWKYTQSLIALLFLGTVLFGAGPGLQGVGLVLLYVHMLVLLFVIHAAVLRPANLLTLLRAFGTLPLLLLIKFNSISELTVLSTVILLLCTDLADGFVARRFTGAESETKSRNATESGAKLDEETDALFTLILAYLLYSYAGYGAWVLSFGTIRYVFVLLFAFSGTRPAYPPSFSSFSRRVCAISASTLAGGFALFLPQPLRTGALLTGLALLTVSFLWEAFLHFRHFFSHRQNRPAKTREGVRRRFRNLLKIGGLLKTRGLLKSFIIYYAVPTKGLRMKRLYRQFLAPGSLAFDIGSHLGNRIGVWSRLGARVVALEPNPDCRPIIETLHGHRSNLTFLPMAVGAQAGRATMYSDPAHPTLNTLSSDWIETVKNTSPFAHINWTAGCETQVVTLDMLIRDYGVPDFCKIDVEGFELQVLNGLSTPLPALSVEYIPSAIEEALRCIERLQTLGSYEFNLSARETMHLKWKQWQPARKICSELRGLPVCARAGDIYARLLSIEGGPETGYNAGEAE